MSDIDWTKPLELMDGTPVEVGDKWENWHESYSYWVHLEGSEDPENEGWEIDNEGRHFDLFRSPVLVRNRKEPTA